MRSWLRKLGRRLSPPEWSKHPSAPAQGEFICHYQELADGQPHYFNIGEGLGGPFFCFLILRKRGIHAFLAICPHRQRPLGTEGNAAMFRRDNIACAHHGALFNVDSGACTNGPCEGQRLCPVDVWVRESEVLIGFPD